MVKHILLVDDESTILMVYRRLLEGPELQVDTAETLEEAAHCISSREYQVVISDLRLSGTAGLEGFSVLKLVREHHEQTKVILLTAYGNPEIREKAISLGASEYFEKPVPTRDLRLALSRLGV